MFRTLGLAMLYSSLALSASPALAASQFHLDYSVHAKGQKIGTIKLSRLFQSEAPTETMALVSKVQAKGWWGKWSLSTTSRTKLDGLTPVSFDHKITEDGKSFYIRGEHHGSHLWSTTAQVKTDNQIETEELAGTALSIVSELVPPLGMAVSIASLLDDPAKQPGRKIAISDFDVVREQLPTYLLQGHAVMAKSGIKVIDTETLEITMFKPADLGREKLSIGGEVFDCRIIDLKSKEGQMTYWLSEKDGRVHIVKEKGEDGDGPYELRLEAYRSQ